MRIAEKAPERAKQRVEAQIALGPHPRHIHPSRNRLTGGALKKAVNKHENELVERSRELERRDMADGRIKNPSVDGRHWLWSEIMRGLFG